MKPIVIIGTGLGGYSLAREFRALDKETPLVLVTADSGDYYSKPMLSNALAQGKDAEGLVLSSAETMSDKLDATILTESWVSDIDPTRHKVTVGAEIIEYRALVLAIGAKPIHLYLTGTGADDVLSVNNLADYALFREKLDSAKRISIIGPGLIGCEFANDLLQVEKEVTVIGPDPHPISTLLPEAAGQSLQRALESAGINFQLGTVTGDIDRAGEGYRVQLQNGEVIESDLVLSAVGLRPNTALAEQTGLTINRGIVTNALLETSEKDIYALGDCAEVDGQNLPFVMPLMHGAKALAKTLSGEPTKVVYPPMPVVIKTPAHPVLVQPPAPNTEGEWQIEQAESGVKALFVDDQECLKGFVLTGEAVAQKQALVKEMAA